MNNIKTWRQGSFIDQEKYRHMPDSWRNEMSIRESLLVRPSPTGNAICMATKPADAIWIAQRLNLASNLEQLTYDFATGKTNGEELVKFVKESIND